MAPKAKRLGPKRSSNSSAATTPVSPSAEYERARVCLRIRPALSEQEGGLDNVALQCDRESKLLWVLSDDTSSLNLGDAGLPKQFAFDGMLEQDNGQLELFELVGVPTVNAVRAGGNGCIICYGASGAGKEYSMRCERPGQEGLLSRIVALLMPGAASAGAASPRRLPVPSSELASEPRPDIALAYLLVAGDGKLHDLFSGSLVGFDIDIQVSPHGGDLLDLATWEKVASPQEVMRLLARGDTARTAFDRKTSHALLFLQLDGGSILGLVTLATIEAVAPQYLAESKFSPGVAESVSALGKCFEAMASSATRPPFDSSLLTTLLTKSLGGGDAGMSCMTTLLLCVHPHKAKLPLTLEGLNFAQLCVPATTFSKSVDTVDYTALSAQLMVQRDSKQEALHELECRVLRELRPQLEEVMQLEERYANLQLNLQQTQWEARSFADKQGQIQMQLEQIRSEHAPRMNSLQAERSAIINELQQVMSAVQGSSEFAADRRLHAQDTEAVSSRLAALQAEVEAAEATVSAQAADMSKACTALPGVARDLGALALGFTEREMQADAAAVFTHALALLEGAFGSGQPEVAAFKAEVHRVVTSNPTDEGDTKAQPPTLLLQVPPKLGSDPQYSSRGSRFAAHDC